jgi:prepilin-type N-terminal cleavage/methylation domain-containing protein
MKFHTQKGFTLLEVLVATAVMATTFIAIAGVFNTLHQINARANTLTTVTQLAQKQLEKIRNTPYTNITVGTTDISSIMTPYANIGSPKTASITTMQVDPNGLKSVDITINYTDHKYPKIVKLTTLVALNGVNK